MCFTKKNKNNRSTKYNSSNYKIPFIQEWWKAGWGSERGNGTGRKSIKISPGMGLANARKELQKNLWAFQTHRCLKSILVGVRKILPLTFTRDKSLESSERMECGQGPWQGRPHLPWEGMEVSQEELPQCPSDPTCLLWVVGDQLSDPQQPSVWQEMGVVMGILLQKNSATQGRLQVGHRGRVFYLRKLPRRRSTIGKGMLCQGCLLHWC